MLSEIKLMFVFHFQLNISYPATGCQKLIEFDDEKKVRMFYEKRMGQELAADSLGDEWKVYYFIPSYLSLPSQRQVNCNFLF